MSQHHSISESGHRDYSFTAALHRQVHRT